MQYRKKPVIVDAVQWHKMGDHEKVESLKTDDLHPNGICKHCLQALTIHGWIKTLEGGHIVCPADWIIRGIAGEYYPCKPAIFAETYNPVKPEEMAAGDPARAHVQAVQRAEQHEKTLFNSDVDGAKKNVPDLVVFGNGDLWQLVSKASSQREGWMKSTKVKRVPGVGCFLQVTTQQRNPDGSYAVAEAVTFAPGVDLMLSSADGKLVLVRGDR